MYCSRCGSGGGEGLSFCRKCGADLEGASLARGGGGSLSRGDSRRGVSRTHPRDADEMTAEGIGSVIVGDGFFITAVILSATHTPISSLLWLLLLVPAFFCFGRGMKDVLHASRIRRRQKRDELGSARAEELPPRRASVADIIGGHGSSGLLAAHGATKRTTGEL